MVSQQRSVDSEEPVDEGKTNVCPICERSFNTVAGLRQHWSKSHTVDKINAIIADKTQKHSQPTISDHSALSDTNHTSVPSWNKFQIISNGLDGENYHQFDIIANSASGDCLFLAVFDFLKTQTLITNTPSNAHELRTMTVQHILGANDSESNFERFKHNLIINLQSEIPSFSSSNTPDQILKLKYADYMSLPGRYGTTAELCAMAEIFNFGFCVIQMHNATDYKCYDYGSTEKVINQQSGNIIHLLFTGNAGRGHFELLSPDEGSINSVLSSGNYKLNKDHTSSRLTCIAPQHFIVSDTEHTSEPTEMASTLDTSFEDFAILLARCKSNIRVLKRVPRGARILAANKLSKCVGDCLANPNLAKNWKNLLTFAYSSLRVPEKVNNVSLASMVKRNIEKSELSFTRHRTKRTPISLSKRVEYKIAEGDIKGAVRILSSTDTLAPQNESTFQQLKQKHPPPSREMNFPAPPEKDVVPLAVSEKDVFYSIKSFPNGSGSGIDGILPQHLKDLTLPSTGESGLRLLKSLTALSNYMLSGKVQSDFIKIMYGASLCALDKKGGGVRPIAVGNTFRRLTSKLACSSVRSNMSSKFAPRQVGFGIKGGCEAAAHATRTFIKKNSHRKVVIVKIDFRNAFNEVDRDFFLNEMKVNCPGIFPYLWQCYSSPSLLFYGDYIIWSENGAQQGDPCGPLLFSSAIQFVINALVSEFIIFYLDDGTIAGEYDSVLQDFKTTKEECAKIGLQINPMKCELFFCSEIDQDIVNKFNELSPGICVINELTLLGTPITDNAFENIFNVKLGELKLLFDRLLELDSYHIALYLLKNCFAIPKLVYLLRTSPTWNRKEFLEQIDGQIKSTLESLTNSKLDDNTWLMASLPVNSGGIGVRRVQDTALPAFLSSVNEVSPLVSIMLRQSSLQVEEIAGYQDSLNVWNCMHPNAAQPEKPSLQKQWNWISVVTLLTKLSFERDEDIARFLAVKRPESGAWLHALPSKPIGTLLDNNSFRIIIGLRLGIDICAPHVCGCGSLVDKKGHHGLKCRFSAGRHARHAGMNTTLKRALILADVPAALEPVGLAREDGKRVDGMSLIPWSRGSTLIWDATCTDTFAPSNLRFSTREAGRAAEDKARRKVSKYQSLINQNYFFVPFAVETMGPWCKDAINFFEDLSRMITLKTHEPRSKSFLQQKLSMEIQRGNAAAVMGTFRSCDKMEEIFYLL